MSDSNAGQEAKKKLSAAASAFVPKATAAPFVPGAGQRPPQPPMNPQMQQPGYYPDYNQQQQFMYQQQMYGYMPPGAYGGHPGGRGGYGGQGAAYYPKPGHYQGQQQQGSDVPQQQNGSQGASPATNATAAPAADEKKSNSKDKDKVKENENNSKTDDNSKGATAVSTEPKAAVAKEEAVATSTTADKPAAAAAPESSRAAAPATEAAKPVEPASMWRRDATAAAATKASDASIAASAADVTDWSRGKMMAEPIAEVIKRNDGRLRYDKRSMLALYVPYTGAIPDRLKSLYSMCSQAARTPQGIEAMNREKDGRKHHHNNHHHNNSHNNSNNNNNNNSGSFGDDYVLTAEDVAEFKSALKSGFHYDPSRLNDDKNTAAVTINKANLTLNKLSVEKFDKLSDEFLGLGLHHDDLMDKTVDMIVKKAQMQAPFAFMYAKLCRKMTDHWNDIPFPTDGSAASNASAADTDAADDDGSNKEHTYGKQFIRKLLQRCEKEFDLDRTGMLLEITQNTELPEDDREEQEVKLKTRFEGHMKFVGELFHNDLITTKTVLAILREDFLPKTDEESLVCMVKLIETLGKKLEEVCYKKKKHYESFQFIFDEISKLAEKKDMISVRVKCLLKGVIDLRDNRWVPRIQQLKAGKTSKSKTAPATVPSGWTTVPQTTKPSKAASTGRPQFGAASKSQSGPFSGDARKAGNKFDALDGQSPTKKNAGKSVTERGYFGSKSSAGAPKTSSAGGFGALSLDTNEEDDAEGDDAAGCSSPDVLQATSLPEDVVNRLKGRAHEYLKEVVSEAQTVVEIQEMLKTVATNAKNPNPLAYAVSVKYFLSMVMDGKDGDRDAICNMFAALVSRNVLSKEQFFDGLRIFLNDFDDLLLDTPHLLGYLAFILARCSAVHNLVDLTVLVNIPDENMFATSSYCGPLIAQTLRHVVALASAGGSSSSSSAQETTAVPTKGGLEVARELYRGSGVDFSKFVLAGRGETEASALADFLNKHQIAEVVKI